MGVLVIAERIGNAVAAQTTDHNGQRVVVAVSVGVAMVDALENSWESAFQAVD